MSVQILSTVFKAEIPDLSYTKNGEQRKAKASTVKIMLLAYADHSNDDGEASYPGYTLLERKTALSRQGIADTLEALTQNGFMVLVGISKHGTNDYKINIAMIEALVKPLDYQTKERVKPLDSAESSHLTGTSQATRLEPSLTILKPSFKTERGGEPISAALLELGIIPNQNTGQYIDDWKLHHTDDWILKAIELAKIKKARSEKYVDAILVGWEANGYPKPRQERVREATKKTNSQTTADILAAKVANYGSRR
jgi:hypothetical protein